MAISGLSCKPPPHAKRDYLCIDQHLKITVAVYNENRSEKVQSALISVNSVRRWMLVSADGQAVIRCPVCQQILQPDDMYDHYLKEMKELSK